MAKNVNCPFCGKLTDPKLSNCPHCGGPITPGALADKESKAAPGVLPRECPNCHGAVHEGDIVCVQCGTNLLTGQRIAKNQEEFIQQESAQRERRPLWPWLLAAGIVVLVGLAVVAVVLLWVDPVEEAQRLAESGNVLEAVNVLQRHLNENPGDAEGQYVMGQLSLDSQQYESAEQAFEAASRLEPENPSAGMLAVYAASLQSQEPALSAQIANLRRVVEHHPDHVEAWMLLALLHGMDENYSAQIEALEHVLAQEPGEVSVYRFIGMARALQGDLDAGRRDIERALRADTQDADAAAALGLIAQAQGDTESAVTHLNEALDYGATITSQAQTRLGMIYVAEGDYEAALPLLRQARENDDAPLADFYFALSLQSIGLDVEALQAFEQLSDQRNHPMAGEAALQMAILLTEQQDAARAQEALRQATSLGADPARTQTVQGRVHVMNGELGEAQQAFRRAIQSNPEYPAAHLESGLLYVNRGVLSEGIRALERYLELADPEVQAARYSEIELLLSQLQQAQQGT